MLALSATQAITPAVERTRSLLFRPFAWGTFLKLCAVGVLTEGFGGNFNSSHSNPRAHIGGAGSMPFHLTPNVVVTLVFLGLAVLVLAIVLFYVVIRLRFALFDCLIHQSKLIAPGWRKYRFQAFRFFLFSITVGLVLFIGLIAILLPFAAGFVRLFHETQRGGPFPIMAALGLILPLIPIFLLFVLLALAVDLVLRDFMLPHFALENASAGQAWAAVRAYIAREMGSFFLYAVLRIVLPVAAGIALVIALAIPCLLVFGSLGAAMVALHVAVHHAALGALIAGRIFEAILGLIIAAVALLLVVSVGGPLCIAVRNYALVFYGGRYQALGNILYPPQTSPAQPGIG
ncbi:MAG TPA: hypothetical protein VL967_16110 [Terracidiphilus sp.]|nr:hypothetical protein [Terracidiphilus sp.]